MTKEEFIKLFANMKMGKNKYRKNIEDKRNCSFEKLVEAKSGKEENYFLARGYFMWSSEEEPSRLAGPYKDKDGNSWAFFQITDERFSPFRRKNNPLLSVVELHEVTKLKSVNSRHTYPHSVITRLEGDKGDDYWDVYVGEDICSRSELTESEVAKLQSMMTPVEKVFFERSHAANVCNSGDCSVLLTATKENPIKFYFSGNDDSSWTMTGSFIDPSEKFKNKSFLEGLSAVNFGMKSGHADFAFEVFYFLTNPNWYHTENSRWYFSN